MATTLGELALFKATEHFTSLSEVLDFCRNHPEFEDVYHKVPEFWKKTLSRFHSSYWIESRGDLEDEEWYTFAKAMKKPRLFSYSLIRIRNEWQTQVAPGRPQTGVNFPFEVIGLDPRPGTIGYVAVLEWDDMSPTVCCFLHHDPRTAFLSATKFAADEFRKEVESFRLGEDDFCTIYCAVTRQPTFPSSLPPNAETVFAVDVKNPEILVGAHFGRGAVESVYTMVYIRAITF
uniref:Uncharacterized protein n=1 Tax=viral metagenome TaxID=1070528 RepID=A0A6C0CFJ8_9ZZZZ